MDSQIAHLADIEQCKIDSHFSDIEQFKIDSYFPDFEQIKIQPTRLFLLLWETAFTTPFEKNIQNSRTTHRIWHKSCSMIQSAEIINWLGSPVNK